MPVGHCVVVERCDVAATHRFSNWAAPHEGNVTSGERRSIGHLPGMAWRRLFFLTLLLGAPRRH
jgi:hypothetical protein